MAAAVVEELGEGKVEAAIGGGACPHRGAEARSRGRSALDDHHEAGSPSKVRAVLARRVAEDPVEHTEGRQLAGTGPHEGRRWSLVSDLF